MTEVFDDNILLFEEILCIDFKLTFDELFWIIGRNLGDLIKLLLLEFVLNDVFDDMILLMEEIFGDELSLPFEYEIWF